MGTKEETTKELQNQGELRRTTKEKITKKLHNQWEIIRTRTRALKGRNLKVFATIAGKMATCPGISGPRKSLSKATWYPPYEDEWDTEAICVIEEDELALIAMMKEHIDKWLDH